MKYVSGDKELEALFARLADKTATKAEKAGVRAALTPLSRAIRSAINSSPAPSAVKRAARATVGRSMKRAKSGIGKGYTTAKAGFGVGKQTAKQKEKASERAKKGRGVGLSKANIHWAVLGTKKRSTRKGKSTGAMPPLLEDVTQRAFSAAQRAMLDAARDKIRQTILRDAGWIGKKKTP